MCVLRGVRVTCSVIKEIKLEDSEERRTTIAPTDNFDAIERVKRASAARWVCELA